MLARRLLAGTLVFGMIFGSGNLGVSQEEEVEKKIEKRAIGKWIEKAKGGEKIDEELQKKVMGQLKKALKKFEKELGEDKLAGILKSVEQKLEGKLNEFHFEFDGVDAADLQKKMADKLSHFEKTFAAPHIMQLHGDKKVIGVMLGQVDGKRIKIEQVMEGSAAEEAGIKKGDIVIKVNGKKVDNPESISEHVQKSKGKVEIEVKREDEVIEVEVEPKKVSANGFAHKILKLEDLKAPLIKLGAGEDIIEIHEDLIKKVAPKGKDGKAHGIILVKPDGTKKDIQLKIDRAAENRKLLHRDTEEMKTRLKKRVEIKSDLGETIEKLQKQVKELQAEIKKLKKEID